MRRALAALALGWIAAIPAPAVAGPCAAWVFGGACAEGAPPFPGCAGVGYCEPGGRCTVNAGHCAPGGRCLVNVGYCDENDVIVGL